MGYRAEPQCAFLQPSQRVSTPKQTADSFQSEKQPTPTPMVSLVFHVHPSRV
jgi:hypothetical protein